MLISAEFLIWTGFENLGSIAWLFLGPTALEATPLYARTSLLLFVRDARFLKGRSPCENYES